MLNGKIRTKEGQSLHKQFKATAVKSKALRSVLIQDVAEALEIHPFMLALWRKHGVIVAKPAKIEVQTAAELKPLRELERKFKVLKEEHALLKQAIRFASDRKRKSSNTSKQTGSSTNSR